MENEGSYVALGLKVWKAQIERADKLFGSLSSEEVLREIAPGRNRLLYLWGHLKAINGELSKGFEKMAWSDWVQRHSAVSEEDFAKDASRNRFAILLSRTNHLSYHLGQAVLGLK